MPYLKQFALLSLICLMVASCAQPDNRPAPEPFVVRGVVYAPQGGEVSNTFVVACYIVNEVCDEAKSQETEVLGSGAQGTFVLSDLENLSYNLFAVKDVNGDGDYSSTGDYYGEVSGTVTPPKSGLDIRMTVLGDDPGPDVGTPEPYVVKGRVTDSQGNPLPGVEVFADNTAYYDMNVFGVTDVNGYYRIELGTITPSSWQVGAYLERDYQGNRLDFPLHPDNDTVFAGVDGAIRNLEWRISGERPGGGYYGGLIYVYTYEIEFEEYVNEYIELTFTPDGPLIDGSAGETFTRSPEGISVYDVPVGRYTVTARYAEPGKEAVPLLLRARYESDYRSSASIVFEDDPLHGLMAELELKSQ